MANTALSISISHHYKLFMPIKLTECPECGTTWPRGSTQWELQECQECGYPEIEILDIDIDLDADEGNY